MLRARLPSEQHARIALEDFVHVEQQVTEVHRVHRAQPLAIETVDGRERRVAAVAAGAFGECGGPNGVVLELLDSRARHFGRRCAWQRCLLDHAAHHRHRVALIEDRKVRLEAKRLGLLAQNTRAGRMKRADPRPARIFAHQRRDPRAHLAGRLVGESHGQHPLGRRLAFGQQVGDTVGQHAGFARACAGQDQNRPFGREHGVALGGIEIVEVQHQFEMLSGCACARMKIAASRGASNPARAV